jgi:hypothetical protein
MDSFSAESACVRRRSKLYDPGSTPKAIYAGNRYGADINSAPPNLPSCGYDAAEMEKAYGLDKVYKKTAYLL